MPAPYRRSGVKGCARRWLVVIKVYGKVLMMRWTGNTKHMCSFGLRLSVVGRSACAVVTWRHDESISNVPSPATSYMYTCISLWTTKSSINTCIPTYLIQPSMHFPCLASVSIKFCFNQADILCTCHTWEGASSLYTRKKPKYLEKKKTKTSWRETRGRSKLKRGFFTYTQQAMCMMARASAALPSMARQLHLRCYNVTPGTG